MVPSLKKLTIRNKKTFFATTHFEIGELVRYDPSFLYREVEKYAAEYNVIIKYCAPESSEYKKYGSFIFQILKSGVIIEKNKMSLLCFILI